MPDPALDVQGGVGVQEPPDLKGDIVDISDLQTTADGDQVYIATDDGAATLTVSPALTHNGGWG